MKYYTTEDEYNDWNSFQESFWGYKTTDLTKKVSCDCGSHKTYGEDIPTDAHSSWCQLFKERIKE